MIKKQERYQVLNLKKIYGDVFLNISQKMT